MAIATRTKTTIRPLDDRLLIRPSDSDDMTSSGIYLPEGAKEKPMTGRVVATGPGKFADDGTRTPISVKKGDKVLFGKYGGTEIDIDGDEHMILRENELLGIVED